MQKKTWSWHYHKIQGCPIPLTHKLIKEIVKMEIKKVFSLNLNFKLDTCSQGGEERIPANLASWPSPWHLWTLERKLQHHPQLPWRWGVSHGAGDLLPHSTVCLWKNQRKRTLILPTKRCKIYAFRTDTHNGSRHSGGSAYSRVITRRWKKR